MAITITRAPTFPTPQQRRGMVGDEAPVISLLSGDDVTSDDSEATMDYPDDSAIAAEAAVPIPVADAIKKAAVPIRIVPKTIADLWQSVETQPHCDVEPPRCTCNRCPYNSAATVVPLMRQRYDLMQRLVALERQLYGI